MTTPYGGGGPYESTGSGYDPAAQGLGSSAYDPGVQPDSGYAGGYDAGGGSTAVGATAAPGGYPDVEDQSLGSLVGRLSSDVSTLVRQELALAKAELREEGKKAGKGAGMLGGAGLAGYFVLLFLSLTLMWALGDELMPLWAAALIVMVLWAIAAAVLFVMGRKQLKEVNPKPEQTVETLKEDKEWVKAQKS